MLSTEFMVTSLVVVLVPGTGVIYTVSTGLFMTLVIFILYGISANSVRLYVVKSPKSIVRLQRSFALVFAVLSVKLAMTER